MKSLLSCVLSALLLPANVSPSQAQSQTSQTKDEKQSAQQTESTAPVVKAPFGFGLEEGTPVKLRINRTISSEDAQVGDTVDFEVLEDVNLVMLI